MLPLYTHNFVIWGDIEDVPLKIDRWVDEVVARLGKVRLGWVRLTGEVRLG